MKLRKFQHFLFIALAVIILDQVTKWLAYEYLRPYNIKHISGDWLKLQYMTNPGMAFGLEINAWWGKIVLTLFRLGAMVAIIWYMKKLFNSKAHTGLLICIALILAGAVGNLVDSTFYALLDPELMVDNAPFALFHGQVIDFIYIDMGTHWGYKLWPIFNVADSSIFVSVAIILVRQKAFFNSIKKGKEINKEGEITTTQEPIQDAENSTAK